MSANTTYTTDSAILLRRSVRQDAGPFVWAVILVATCVLLLVFQKMLWLVVPMLLGLILYYLLVGFLSPLIYWGRTRESAAAIVMGSFLLVTAGLVLAAVPWVVDHLGDWQALVLRYFDGGLHWILETLRWLEASFSFLRNAGFAEKMSQRMTSGSGDVVSHVEVVLMGAAVWAPSLLLSPFLAFFFLRDGHAFNRFLSHAVPNAFFERTLALMHEIDQTLRAYFVGLIKLTVLDTVSLGLGLWLLGFPGPWVLGLICAVFAWIPYVGSILGGLLVVLVAATDFPTQPTMAYWAIALFGFVRLLDDFVYMPMTIGKSLHMHPLITVVMIFAGGAIAGISGLMLVLPVLGVVMVIGTAVGQIVTDERLMARHRFARELRRSMAARDLRGPK